MVQAISAPAAGYTPENFSVLINSNDSESLSTVANFGTILDTTETAMTISPINVNWLTLVSS